MALVTYRCMSQADVDVEAGRGRKSATENISQEDPPSSMLPFSGLVDTQDESGNDQTYQLTSDEACCNDEGRSQKDSILNGQA